MKHLIHRLCIYIFFSLATSAVSAEIKFLDDIEMGCSIIISGTIQFGDSLRLKELIAQEDSVESYWAADRMVTGRICLDSTGGDMQEGLALADVIGGLEGAFRGTAVGPHARCESACALAFMAGRSFPPEGEYALPNRILHPLGALGFHRPELIMTAEKLYSSEQVSSAFSIAIDSISLIINRRASGAYSFPESLFETMLSTPAESMHYIETVGAAARIGITVPTHSRYNNPLDNLIRNICENGDMYLLDRPTYSVNSGAPVSITQQGSDVSATIVDGYRQEASYGCSVILFGGDNFKDTGQIGYGFIGDYDPDRWFPVYAFYTFPPEYTLSDL